MTQLGKHPLDPAHAIERLAGARATYPQRRRGHRLHQCPTRSTVSYPSRPPRRREAGQAASLQAKGCSVDLRMSFTVISLQLEGSVHHKHPLGAVPMHQLFRDFGSVPSGTVTSLSRLVMMLATAEAAQRRSRLVTMPTTCRPSTTAARRCGAGGSQERRTDMVGGTVIGSFDTALATTLALRRPAPWASCSCGRCPPPSCAIAIASLAR